MLHCNIQREREKEGMDKIVVVWRCKNEKSVMIGTRALQYVYIPSTIAKGHVVLYSAMQRVHYCIGLGVKKPFPPNVA